MDSKVKASIISCILLAMVSISYGQGAQVTVTRNLPDNYTPGQNITVTLTMNVNEANPPGASIGVEDIFPAGWTFVSANPAQGYLPSVVESEHKLGWLFWSLGLPIQDTVITYILTPPAGESGTKTFSGTVVWDSEPSENIAGDTQISRAAAKLAFTAQPVGPYAAGEPINAIPQVTVQDSSGNTITTSIASITVAIKTGTGTSGATLFGTKTVNAVNGVATFSDLSIDLTGTGYRLTATSQGLTSADSDAFGIIGGAALRLAFTTSPDNGAAGANLAPAPVVAVKDNFGNTVTSSTAEVAVAIKNGTGTLSGTTTVNAVNGVATFTNLSIKPEGTYQLTATSGGLASADSDPFTLTGIPALTIEKSDDQDPVDPNTEVAYTITYGNVGLGAASNTVIVETLPADLIYVSSTGGGVYNSTARTITWPIGTLNAEDVNNTVTFTARVANTGSILEGGTITNSALTIDCDETDPAGQIIPETTTVNDKKAPETSGHIPDPNSIQVARDTIIQLHVTDGGSRVDVNAVKIWVGGDLIYDGANETSSGVYDSNSLHPNQAVRGICRRVGSDADYTFVFQSLTPFDYEQKVDVTVNAADKAGNVMPEKTYHFYTAMRSFGKNAKVNTDTGTLVQNNPATVTDSEGNIWIVWDQTNAAGNTDIFIGRLPVDANAFADSVPVVSDSNNQRNPAIAVDGNDVVYVAWENDDPNGHWDIFVSASANGTTWSTPVKVDVGDPCNTTDQISPAIAIDRAAPNSIYVAWQDTRAGDKDIWLATSTDGISWTETQVTTDATDQTGPIVAVDPNNVVYVAWTDSRNLATAGMDIYGASSAEVPWTNVALVNTDRNELSPAGAASEFMHLLWVADANGYSDILYGNDANDPPLVGASIIDPNEPNAVTVGPAVAITTRGSSTKVFACWEDSRNVVNNNGDTDIYFAEGRSPFGTNILVNDDTGVHRQAKPAIGVDKNGNPYIVWVDNRSGNDDIYTAGSTCLGSALPTTVTDVNGVVTVQATADLQVTIPDLPDGIDANDIRITEVSNPPQMPAATGGFGLVYSFGPSGLQFSPPATIRIPLVNDPGYSVYRVFRYDPGDLTSPYFPWSEDGIHNPATKVPGQTPYLKVQVDHFSLFSTGGAAAGASYHHGDGGCALSPSGGATPVEFLLPFAGYVVVLLVITCADAYRRRSSSGKH